MSSITVTPNLQTKSVSSSTSAQTITPDSGYCRLRQVNISAFSGKTVQEGYYTIYRSDLQSGYNSGTEYPYIYQYRITQNLSFPSTRAFFITSINFTGQTGENMFALQDTLTIQQIYSSSQWNSTGHSYGFVYNSSTGSMVTREEIYIFCQLSEINEILGLELYMAFKSNLNSYFQNVSGTATFGIWSYCF